MGDYFGKIDMDNLPEKDLIVRWGREARENYTPKCGRSYDRFEMEYVNDRIIEWQRKERGIQVK